MSASVCGACAEATHTGGVWSAHTCGKDTGLTVKTYGSMDIGHDGTHVSAAIFDRGNGTAGMATAAQAREWARALLAAADAVDPPVRGGAMSRPLRITTTGELWPIHIYDGGCMLACGEVSRANTISGSRGTFEVYPTEDRCPVCNATAARNDAIDAQIRQATR